MPPPAALTPTRYYARVFALGTAALLGYLLWRLLSPFAAPILWAALLAFMLQPANRRLLEKWKKPALAAGLLTGAAFLVIAGPVTLFVFAFIRQATELLQRFQAEAHDRKLPALQMLLELSPVQASLAKAGEFTSLTKEQILQSAADAAQGVLQQAASLGGSVLVGTVGVITQFALTLFLLFFFLRDGREMLMRGVRLVPMTSARKEELAGTLGGVTRAVVLGTLATAGVQGTLVGIGFAIAGLASPLVFGAVGALASLIPIVGTALVWVPAAITLVAQGQTGWAIFLVAWSVILVAGSDNVVRPLIISGQSNASTLLVFIGLLGGINVFGFAGIFMGPLVLTLVAALLRYADAEVPRSASQAGGRSPLASSPPDSSPPESVPPGAEHALATPSVAPAAVPATPAKDEVPTEPPAGAQTRVDKK
jgi:predicted PurR-regulated permease PerM